MRFLFFLHWIVLFIGCKQEKSSVSNFEYYPDTTIISKTRFHNERIEILTSYFNLPKLTERITDSLVIRFWPWEAFEFWSNMFEFRLDSNGWKGYHYCSYTFPNQHGKIFHIYGHDDLGDSVFIVKQIIPKCGWNKFYDSLHYFKLRTLPTQSLINNFKYQDILDGDGVSFEIASKNSYRWIQYDNPDNYSYLECKSIASLKEMFIRQFGDDYFWPRITVKRVSIIETKNPPD